MDLVLGGSGVVSAYSRRKLLDVALMSTEFEKEKRIQREQHLNSGGSERRGCSG